MGMRDYGQKKVCLMFNIYFKEMKKFFSLIALVGVFAACQPEQIETAFKVAGAKLTVNVQFVDLNGNAYADASIASSTAGTVSGNSIVFEAPENSAVPAQTITVTASTPKLATKTRTLSVAVPDVIAGGVGSVNVQWPVGDQPDDWNFELVPGTPEQTLWDVQFLDNPHYDTYSHAYKHNEVDIDTWYLNDSDYILTGQVTYKMWMKSEVAAISYNFDAFKPVVDAYAYPFEDVEVDLGEGKLDFKVSAYGMWAAWQKAYLTEQTYEVVGTKGSEKIVAGTFMVLAENTQVAEEVELGMPVHLVGHGTSSHTSYHTVYTHGHDEHGHPHVSEHTYSHDYEITYPIYSHYVYGKGHAGGASNAGGGIIFSE